MMAPRISVSDVISRVSEKLLTLSRLLVAMMVFSCSAPRMKAVQIVKKASTKMKSNAMISRRFIFSVLMIATPRKKMAKSVVKCVIVRLRT